MHTDQLAVISCLMCCTYIHMTAGTVFHLKKKEITMGEKKRFIV